MKSKIALVADKRTEEFAAKAGRIAEGAFSSIKAMTSGSTNWHEKDITDTIAIMTQFINKDFAKTLADIYTESYNENTSFITSEFKGRSALHNLLSSLSTNGLDNALATTLKSSTYPRYVSKYEERTETRLGDLFAQLYDGDLTLGAFNSSVKELIEQQIESTTSLMQTEGTYMNSHATLDSSRKLGVSRYIIVATMDNRTSDICQSMNGKVFTVNDAEDGKNVPPFHPNCRSIVIPFDMNDFLANGEDTTYEKWLDDYLDRNYVGLGTSQTNLSKTSRASAKKRYYRMEDWQDDLDDRIIERLEALPSNLTTAERAAQLEKIVKEEAYKLQTAYLTMYTYGPDSTKKLLAPLFEKFDTFKSPELYNIFMRSLFEGSMVGLSRAIAESGGAKNTKDDNHTKNTNSYKTFTSSDKYVGETATAIEAKYPGKVVDVNKIVKDSNGRIITDFDIELDNVVIQVKSGTAKGLTRQMQNTAASTSKTVVGYTPDLNPSSAVVRGVQKAGYDVFTTLEELLNFLASH